MTLENNAKGQFSNSNIQPKHRASVKCYWRHLQSKVNSASVPEICTSQTPSTHKSLNSDSCHPERSRFSIALSSEFEMERMKRWRQNEKKKMIIAESGIFWMNARWHSQTDCEWHSMTSPSLPEHLCCQRRSGGVRLCYHGAVILLLNNLQLKDYIRQQYTERIK